MIELSIVTVFLVGLLGGVHCLGMCGSIVGILTAQLPVSGSKWPFHFAYNGGRILSYTLAGALVGAIGQAGLVMRDQVPVQHLLFALSSLMLIALGLYLAGIWNVVSRIEKAGGVLWRHIQPLARTLFPITTPSKAFLLGMLWGWLPCGLVYSVLVTALSSGSPLRGAMIMLAFALGTLPNLLLIGMFWERCRHWIQAAKVRLFAGAVVIAFGVYGLFKIGYIFATYGWVGSCHVDL